jgi:hypothetical protein
MKSDHSLLRKLNLKDSTSRGKKSKKKSLNHFLQSSRLWRKELKTKFLARKKVELESYVLTCFQMMMTTSKKMTLKR